MIRKEKSSMSKTSQKLQKHSILEAALSDLSAWPAPAAPQVSLSETPFQGYFILRALDTLKTLNENLEPVFGQALSNKPNKAGSKKGIKIFWLREGQWAIVTSEENKDKIRSEMEKALSNLKSSLVDNSSGYTMLTLKGEKARDTLMKGCPLDLHPAVFKTGHMALSRVMHADILLHHPSKERYDLYIRKSFAEYLLRWLHDGALEYGVEIKTSEAA